MKKYIFLLLATFSCLSIQVADENDIADNYLEFTLMTYNVRNCKGIDNVTDYQRVANAILKEAPDVVAVQELDSVTGRSKGVDVLATLADMTLMHYVYSASINYDGGKYGIGILSKERPIGHYSVALPGREEQRQLLIVEFGDYIFACTHLSLTEEDRIASLAILRREAQAAQKPFFIAGDWNATPYSNFIKEMKNDFRILSNEQLMTFPADNPTECIDYIAQYSGNPNVLPVSVPSDYVADEPVTSDHRPVVVKIRFRANASDIFYGEPYIQNPVDGGVTIMWQTNVPAYGWVEYGTDTIHLQRARTIVDGQVVCNDIFNKVRLTNLKAGQTYYYRVCSQEMLVYKASYKEFGETVKSPFHTFRLPAANDTDFAAIIFNDIHKRQEVFEALLKQVGSRKYDFVVFNGDCIDDPASEEEALTHLSRFCKNAGAADKPVFFLRGNHEIRNAYSIGLRKLFDYVGDKTYGAFNWGDTRIVMLDCGENKPDTAAVYYDLNDFTQLRNEQCGFLKTELESKAFKNAKCRILISHIPLYGYNRTFHPSKELWSGLLAKAPFNIYISSHLHRFAFYPKGSDKGNPFPAVVGGGPDMDSATVMIFQKKGAKLTLTVLNTKGETLLEKDL